MALNTQRTQMRMVRAFVRREHEALLRGERRGTPRYRQHHHRPHLQA